MSFWSWFRQPTTITGIASVIGTVAGTAASVASGSTSLGAGAGAMAFAATHMLINDNTVDTSVANLTQTTVQAATGGVPGLVSASPQIIEGLFGLLTNLANPTAAPAPAPSPPATGA